MKYIITWNNHDYEDEFARVVDTEQKGLPKIVEKIINDYDVEDIDEISIFEVETQIIVSQKIEIKEVKKIKVSK